jgi:hypothetical protein
MLPSKDYIAEKKTGYLKAKNKQPAKLSLRNKSQTKIYLTYMQRNKLRMLSRKLYLSQSEIVGWLLDNFNQGLNKPKSNEWLDFANKLLNTIQEKNNV